MTDQTRIYLNGYPSHSRAVQEPLHEVGNEYEDAKARGRTMVLTDTDGEVIRINPDHIVICFKITA